GALGLRRRDDRRPPAAARRPPAHVRRAVLRRSPRRRAPPRARDRGAAATRPRARHRHPRRSGGARRAREPDAQRPAPRPARGRRAPARPGLTMPPRFETIGIDGIPEVRPGDAVADLVHAAAARQGTPFAAGDVLVVGQKIVSKAEGRLVRLGDVTPSAIGVAGVAPLRSYLGARDPAGHTLQATILAVADELAGAAELVMGKLARIPAAIVRGLELPVAEEGSKPLLRDPSRDLFR